MSIDTERNFVCAVMHDQNILFRVAIKPEDLLDITCRKILQACHEIAGQNATPDFPAVANHLRGDVDPGQIGEINGIGATHVNWEYYANSLKHDIMNRKLENVAPYLNELLRAGEEPKDIISKTSEFLDNIQIGFNEYKIIKFSEILPEWFNSLEKRMSSKNIGLTGIPTGLQMLDDLTGGFQKKNLYYIGARPSDGKSVALNGFMLAAMNSNFKPGIITVESSSNEFVSRSASAHAGVPLSKIKTGSITASQISYLMDSGTKMYEVDPVIYDEPNATLQTVMTQARRMVSIYGVKIILVDYAQLITPDIRGVPRNEQVAETSKGLKALSRSLDIPVVAVAQLRRPEKGHGDKRPHMDDFGETSQFEKDADGAGLIHHCEDKETGLKESFIHWDKNRDGETMSIPVWFNREMVRFEQKEN